MADNQTCYVCNRPCRPGRGLTDNGGRRHIECPVPDPMATKRRSEQMKALRAKQVAQGSPKR